MSSAFHYGFGITRKVAKVAPHYRVNDAPLAFELISSEAELRALEFEWRDLMARSVKVEPMLSPDWLLPWWDHYGASGNRSLAVGLFRDGSRLIGLAPLCRRTILYGSVLPIRRLEILGSGGQDADGIWSEYLSLIAESGREAEVAQKFATALDRGEFGDWDEIVFEFMDRELETSRTLIKTLCEKWPTRVSSFDIPAFYVPLPSTWDNYLQSMRSRHRSWLRRTLKHFECWVGDREVSFQHASSADELRRGMRILKRLHNERWESSGGKGIFRSIRFDGFLKDVSENFFRKGELELSWLTVGGEPVAAHFSLRSNAKVYFFQSGRAVGLPPQVRVGIVMFVFSIQNAIRRGEKEYDFMAGESQYKKRFEPESRRLETVRVCRGGPKEFALQAFYFAPKDVFRSWRSAFMKKWHHILLSLRRKR